MKHLTVDPASVCSWLIHQSLYGSSQPRIPQKRKEAIIDLFIGVGIPSLVMILRESIFIKPKDTLLMRDQTTSSRGTVTMWSRIWAATRNEISP